MKRGQAVLLAAITIVGGLLRLWSPGRIGLWSDEVQFLNLSALPGYHAIVSFLVAHESHPPLLYFVAHALGSFTGNATASMGALSLAASIGLIPAVWWLGTLAGRPATGALSAALVALSVPLSFLGVQLRPYALFSLLLVVSAAAMLRAIGSRRTGWRALWIALLLLLLYLHHLAIFVVAAQVIIVVVVRQGDETFVAHAGRWTPWLVGLGLAALPDLILLWHQSHVTGYLPAHPSGPLAPLGQFGRLGLTAPGELLLGLVASIAVLVRGGGVRRRQLADAMPEPVRIIAAMFLAFCLCLIIMGYRASVLVEHLVLPFAPLGLVAAGALIVGSVTAGRRLAVMIWIQGSVVCVALSAIFSVGLVKTNMDLVARYIAAEATPSDLVLVIPGSFGPGLNQVEGIRASQIDYPFMGPVQLFPFDHFMERITDGAALAAALDTLRAARLAGRTVWLVQPASWMLEETMEPERAGPAAAWRSRAGFLRDSLAANFGHVTQPIDTHYASWSTELVTLERFGVQPEASP